MGRGFNVYKLVGMNKAMADRNLEEVKKLFNKDSPYNCGYLDSAVRVGDITIVKFFIENGVIPREDIVETATEAGNIDILKLVYETFKIIRQHHRLVILAAFTNNLEVISYIEERILCCSHDEFTETLKRIMPAKGY